jgi:hypothetical protein
MITKLNADWDEYRASRNKVNIALQQAKSGDTTAIKIYSKLQSERGLENN